MKIVAFSKSFQTWPIPVMCHRFKEIGLDGVDLTVRAKGHIEPKDVAEQLPLAVKAAAEAGLEITYLSTDQNQPTPEAEKVLATAAKLGIDRIKMGYFSYRPFGTLRKQMDDTRRQIDVFSQFAKKFGVLPCIHIHSGPDIPSHGTMLYELIRDIPPDRVGAYVDSLHMALEGGGEGWRQGLDLLAPWISLVAVKNFAWVQGQRDVLGQVQWKHQVVPVADGVSPIPKFIDTVKKTGYKGLLAAQRIQRRRQLQRPRYRRLSGGTAEDLKFLRKLLKT